MVNLLAINVLLAVAWAAFNETFSLGGLAVGFLGGFAALWVAQPLYKPTNYFAQMTGIIYLMFYFIWDLLLSSIRVLWDVLRPQSQSRPGIIAVPVEGMSDFQILMLANLISLTPGTLSLEVSDDKTRLYVHCMFLDEGPEAVRRSIVDNQIRLIRRVVGGATPKA